MLLNAYMLLIIYARVDLTQLYRILVLFSECSDNKLSIQERVEKSQRGSTSTIRNKVHFEIL